MGWRRRSPFFIEQTWQDQFDRTTQELMTLSTFELMYNYNMRGSMSRKGNCYDNACIESFHGILKCELVYQTNKTREGAKKSLFEYIEFFYNSKRIHSTLGYYTPNEFQRMYGNLAA
jgi:putative transposase